MTATLDQFVDEWQRWNAERNDGLRQPLGWLSLTALHWLDETPTSFDEAPGRWHVNGDSVVHELDGETTTYEPVEGAPGLEAEFDRGFVEIIKRTGRLGIRIHDRTAPALASFTGVPAYEPDPSWVLTGRFEAFDEQQVVTTGAVVDGLEHHHPAAGVVRFGYDGAEHELVAFGDAGGPLRILFTDATSGVTTYPAARILQVEAPAEDGTVTLDFTRAANLPCAFTDAATCPIAPSQNRLPFAVEAGERTPRLGESS
ncbi:MULTISPECIES: DUF1684 domain-containing protein [Rhodococcus]|uniref:DUF1684 domain-containing protein n=1 Tax=Rhodococcus pyridinivorans KG-16 TaxID=1441730 RepID=A0A0V9UR14_9NOCA|nr:MULTISPECIES: DUF1684 domain-containing protein [Rhodococcus]KSZ60450.1 hypothetical protein Z045_03170 [Rhodococcus pyridinivorans KG-16]BDB62074.1 hypothetical protein RDE2_38680 [Rhodococcus sp. RDE2]